VYALGFITDIYLFYAYGNRDLIAFYREIQVVNRGLLEKALYVIVFAVVFFILELRDHPAGLFTLFVTAILSIHGLISSLGSISVLWDIRGKYSALNLSSLNRYIERGTITYKFSTLTYDLGLVLQGLFLLVSLLWLIAVFYNACTEAIPYSAEKGAAKNETI
jgi:hypothetical protein